MNIKFNSLTTAGDYSYVFTESNIVNNTTAVPYSFYNSTVLGANSALIDNTDGDNTLILNIIDYADTTSKKIINLQNSFKRSTGEKTVSFCFGSVNTTSAISTLTLTPTTANWSAGTYVLYGVN